MIKIHFSIKRNPGKKGIVRLKSVSNDKVRFREGQLVITKEGMGTIKEIKFVEDLNEKTKKITKIAPHSVPVYVRNIKHKVRFFKPTELMVVDVIDNKSGDKYPAAESDYGLLLADDSPVEFVVTRKGKALLTQESRKRYNSVRIFAKKQNGIKILNELIQKGIWNPRTR